MKILSTVLLCMLFQSTVSQDRTIVHLKPNRDSIEKDFGGKLLELINAPTIVHLPEDPPKVDSNGKPWDLDIKNLGPSRVTLEGKGKFEMIITVGQTVHIHCNGAAYSFSNR